MFTITRKYISSVLKLRLNYEIRKIITGDLNSPTYRHNYTTISSKKMAIEKDAKSICFADYDAIGFDCDHTLAQYNLYNLFKDTYEIMADYLVTQNGYSKELFKFNPNFCSRGIVLDLETGNFVKLAHDGSILRAFHGTRPLPKGEYESGTFPQHKELFRTMTNIGTRFRIFENFFDMASSLLCAQIIDYLDDKHHGRPGSYNVWPEVAPAVKYVYMSGEFKAADGIFFERLVKDTKRYLHGGSPKLKRWLEMMKANNRPMFILSSTYEDLGVASLDFILGKDWSKYFDFSIFLAEKPRFFFENNPFYILSSSCEQKMVTDGLKNCKYFGGGNLTQLKEHLSLITGKEDPKVLYFGDSQRSDIIPSKVYAGWDTVFILEEMASEACFYKEREDNLKVESCHFEDPSVMPWGSILVDAPESGELKHCDKVQTLVQSVIRKYSNMAVPNLKFLFDYPLGHKFTTFDPKDESSTSGFHPFVPPPIVTLDPKDESSTSGFHPFVPPPIVM